MEASGAGGAGEAGDDEFVVGDALSVQVRDEARPPGRCIARLDGGGGRVGAEPACEVGPCP